MKNTKKKKRRIILFSVLGVLIILAVCFVAIQYDNISAAIRAFNYTDEEISKMMEDNKEKLEKELEEKVPGIVGDFTAEEEEKIISGELSIEEAVKQKEQELEEKQKNTANSGSSGGSYSVDTKTNEIVSKKIIEFYSLKAYYLGQLGQLESQVIADYTALPDSKKNLVGKQEIASKYMSVATSLLSQCDARVDTLLKELEASIKEVDGDLSIITTIKNAYENEKNLKKSYYMSKLK